MDDRELEARLRTHLHRRFDAAQTPPGLADAVQQGFATSARPVGLADLRIRAPRLGWSVILVPLVIAILAFAQLQFGLFNGIGGPRATATPAATTLVNLDRQFIVLPPTAALPTKSETSQATEVLTDRLSKLGFQVITSGAGNAIRFMLPTTGPSDDRIRAVLAANGDVEFVPLPAETYGDGNGPRLEARVGEPLPTEEQALFGSEGIESVAIGEDQQAREVLNIVLTPAAAEAFGDYTTEHVGEYLAIVVDGRVASLPSINEPIPGGEVQLSFGSESEEAGTDTMAILLGGPLPEAWRTARVPGIVPGQIAISSAMGQFPRATVESADLDAELDGEAWRAVWYVLLTGDVGGGALPCPTRGPSGDTCPSPGPHRLVVVDAERGSVIRIEYAPD